MALVADRLDQAFESLFFLGVADGATGIAMQNAGSGHLYEDWPRPLFVAFDDFGVHFVLLSFGSHVLLLLFEL